MYPWPGGENVNPQATGNQQVRNPQKVDQAQVASLTEQPVAASAQQDPIMSMLSQMLSSGMAGPGMNGDMGDFGSGTQTGNEQFPGMAQIPGSGKMEHCGPMNGPTQVKSALMEAKEFMNKCSLARRGPSQKIAINDYSGGSTPMMYIFDLEGNCLGKTAISYGNGKGKVKPLPCSDDGEHLTPAGFHPVVALASMHLMRSRRHWVKVRWCTISSAKRLAPRVAKTMPALPVNISSAVWMEAEIPFPHQAPPAVHLRSSKARAKKHL